MQDFGIESLTLSRPGKRAVFKLAVDIVKADNRIHSNEIAFLDRLQTAMNLPQEDLDMIHYISMAAAIDALSDYDYETKDAIVRFLSGLMKSDSDIDFDEAILLASVEMALGRDSSRWSSVVTSIDGASDDTYKQVVYLEKVFCKEPRRVFDDRYDNLLISKTLSDIGLDLFYLPFVLKDMTRGSESSMSRFELLQHSMEYLTPAGDKGKIARLEEELNALDVPAFSSVVLSRHGLKVDDIPYDAFLLLKIRDSHLLDDNNDFHGASDYLCIDISRDVKHRLLTFVSKLDNNTNLLSYEGYYKILYDYLSSESKTPSQMIIDSDMELRLKDIDGHKLYFESYAQSLSFYLLLLKYGRSGISLHCINDAISYLKALDINSYVDSRGEFDYPGLLQQLKIDGTDATRLIYNILTIYGIISTKDTLSPKFPHYALSILKHRSSLKNYIKNGFCGVAKLSSCEDYCIQMDKEANIYWLSVPISSFFVADIDGGLTPLSESAFWRELI